MKIKESEPHKLVLMSACLCVCVLQMSMSGWCANSTLLEGGDVTFAYDWCPYKYAWLCIVGLALYLLCFSPGDASQLSSNFSCFISEFHLS